MLKDTRVGEDQALAIAGVISNAGIWKLQARGPLRPRSRQGSRRRPKPTLPAVDLRMRRGLADIQLEVRGGDIIVDLPGTNYTVTYHKPGVSPQLLVSYLPVKDDPRTELTQAEFLARAWRLANDKARELGWIA